MKLVEPGIKPFSNYSQIILDLMPPVDMYLSQPVSDFSGDGLIIALSPGIQGIASRLC